MKIQVTYKNFEISNYSKVDVALKAIDDSYDGFFTDENGITFNFLSELSPEKQAEVNTYWDELVEQDLAPTQEEEKRFQQTTQRLWGSPFAQELVDAIGARNLVLAANEQPVNVVAILTALGSVRTMLQTGALKTAYGVIASQRPNFPQYDDIFEKALTDIQTFLVSKGYW